jgi:type VI secretion system secreted protein Hcp
MGSDLRAFSATAGDMYLAVRSARAGDIKGESQASSHVDEIVVHGWSWGLSQQVAAAAPDGGSGKQAGKRRSLRTIVIVKTLDRATTSLMSVLYANDLVRTAVLTMRKSGGQQEDFFKITLTDARVIEIDYVADENASVQERLTLAFTHVAFEYKPQSGTGQLLGANTFEADA